MIVKFPDMPNVTGNIKLPKPAVYLAGSYSFASKWMVRAAKDLESHVGVVFYATQPSGDFSYIKWTLTWLHESDTVGFWIDGSPWAEFELGLLLGRARVLDKSDRPIIGAAKGSGVLGVIEEVLGALGFDPYVYEDFDEWVHAVEAHATRRRLK